MWFDLAYAWSHSLFEAWLVNDWLGRLASRALTNATRKIPRTAPKNH